MTVTITPVEYEFILGKAIEKTNWDAANGSGDVKHDLDRYSTGWTAEFAVMKHMGRELEMNWTIGPGRNFFHPDLPNGFGVKSVRCKWRYGELYHADLKAWLVPIEPTYPEVLCRVHDGFVVDVMGVVTVEQMIRYANPELVIEADNPRKTGFDYWKMLFDGLDLGSLQDAFPGQP